MNKEQNKQINTVKNREKTRVSTQKKIQYSSLEFNSLKFIQDSILRSDVLGKFLKNDLIFYVFLYFVFAHLST